MRCVWCETPTSYYLTVENAMRQNCRVSDSGYHEFQSVSRIGLCFHCIGQCFGVAPDKTSLLRHRRQKRPNTI